MASAARMSLQVCISFSFVLGIVGAALSISAWVVSDTQVTLEYFSILPSFVKASVLLATAAMGIGGLVLIANGNACRGLWSPEHIDQSISNIKTRAKCVAEGYAVCVVLSGVSFIDRLDIPDGTYPMSLMPYEQQTIGAMAVWTIAALLMYRVHTKMWPIESSSSGGGGSAGSSAGVMTTVMTAHENPGSACAGASAEVVAVVPAYGVTVATTSLSDELERLVQLRNGGVIDDAEFTAAKARTLGLSA